MDHPLRSDDNKALRKRIVSLLKECYAIQRQSNVIFVCGGNAAGDMRRLFQAEFPKLLPGFEFFEPEFAMKNYLTLGDTNPFDISEFEELVGDLSHSIVLFPEAPGSFAETGYFSAIPRLAKKIILAIDVNRQKSDSFISLGPAVKIANDSLFRPNIQFNYDIPDFSLISQRIIERAPLHKTKKSFKISKFSDTNSFDLFSLVHEIYSLLGIATTEDVEFFLGSIYRSQFSKSKIKQIISILHGSKRLVSVGGYGHFKVKDTSKRLLHVKDGGKSTHDVLKVDISAACLSADPDFVALLGK